MSGTRPNISVGITAYNESKRGEFQWLRQNLAEILASPHVGDVVVVNDGTPDYADLRRAMSGWFGDRVRVFQNAENLGVFGNKMRSLEHAAGDWCLVADSDNVFRSDYFDRLVELWPWEPRVAYGAHLGKTEFTYQHLAGDWRTVDVGRLVQQPLGWCLANTGNWFVHRPTFLEPFHEIPRLRFDLWQPDYFGAGDRSEMYWRRVYDAQDSFFINKIWWMAGGTLRVVPGLEYEHRVDRSSPGNYDRSPAAKEALAPIYMLELADAAVGRKYGYELIRQNGKYFIFKQSDGKTVVVDFHAGKIESCQ